MYNYTPRTSNSLLLLLGLLLVFLYLSFVLCGQLRGSPLGGNSLLHIIPRVLQQKMRQNASVLPHYSLLSNSCMLLPLYWTSSFFPNSSSFFSFPFFLSHRFPVGETTPWCRKADLIHVSAVFNNDTSCVLKLNQIRQFLLLCSTTEKKNYTEFLVEKKEQLKH